jgi:hypothetical protein
MDAKTRQLLYLVALIVSVVVGGLVMFDLIDPENAKAGFGVIAVGFATLFGIAAKNARD